MSELEAKIQEIRKHLVATTPDDIDQLNDWDAFLSGEFAYHATELAKVKRDRALRELEIKAKLLADRTQKFTEKEVERQYFATKEGQFLAYANELLKAISKLISAVRTRRETMRHI